MSSSSSHPTQSQPSPYAPSPGQLAELEQLAAEVGYTLVYIDNRYTLTEGAVSIYGSRSLAATAGFLRGVRHVIRTAQVAARLAEQVGEPASEAPTGVQR